MEPLEEIRAHLGRLSDPMAFLTGIFAHAPFGLQIYEASGRCLLVTDAFKQVFAAAPPEDYNILKDEIARQEGLLDLIHRAFAGEVVALPAVWYDPRKLQHVYVAEGKRVAIAATFFPLRDANGAVSHVGIVFKDLTNELLAREQAEAERDLLRAVIEQSGDGIIVCDEDGVLHGMNPEAERQHGAGHRGVPVQEWPRVFGLSDMQGRPLPLEETPLYRALHGERVEDAQWRVTRSDGQERILSGMASPLRRPDGSSAGAVLSSRDETERLQLLEKLHEESAEKERLYREAQELNRIKDEFLATVSHELRTPLQAILGWSRLLREANLDPDRAKHALETIERNAKVQAQLVEEILDASRVVTGKIRLEWNRVDLTMVLTAALENARPTAEARGIRLSCDGTETPVSVTGDAERLQQVVWNLLSNAVKFTPEGGRIDLRLRGEEHAAVVEVEDTGPGIAPEFLPHLFDHFRQADSSTTRRHGGLGLGLAIARHLAELHGGTLEAHSAGLGKGARFVLRLPLRLRVETVAPAPVEAVVYAGAPLPSLAGLRVLVVDDEEDTRDLLSVVLSSQGAVVTTVGTAAEALTALTQHPVDVLVSDIGMPGEDGYTLMSRVRVLSAAQGGEVPAVALTAYARAEDRRRALAAGYQYHLSKPIEPGELVRMVARVGEQKTTRTE